MLDFREMYHAFVLRFTIGWYYFSLELYTRNKLFRFVIKKPPGMEAFHPDKSC
jgi:hypothetical protein